MKILAFGASNSKASINKKFAAFAASQIENAQIVILDLNDFEMPIYSMDRENESGYPQLAYHFKEYVKNCDGIIISFAEHNGAYTAAFKNIFDWISRIEKDIWASKPMLLLATSPGERGASTVLEIAVSKFSRMNSAPIFHFSLPGFFENFENEKLVDNEFAEAFKTELSKFASTLKKNI